MNDKDQHLDVFLDHSVFYYNGRTTTFQEGTQSKAAQNRYDKVTTTLKNGYLEKMYQKCISGTLVISSLDSYFKDLLKELVNGVTSDAGRALVGLAFLQITIKSIVPEQSIRLHKGSNRKGSFSWTEGISMRTIDSNYNTPFLRDKELLKLNKDGVMMTRSLAENYPYSKLYKAEMRGAFDTWIKIVDTIESNNIDCKDALVYMISLLINKSKKFDELVDNALQKVNTHKDYSFATVENLLIKFYTDTKYSARAFEVVIHSFMQAYCENKYTDLELVAISQMRSANKKHGNVGDIELKDGNRIVEAWDAKYGKNYLYDELGELQDKLESNPGVTLAGFIVNDSLDLKSEIIEKKEDVSIITETDIKLYTFKDWVTDKLELVPKNQREKFAKDWLVATVETFARKRLTIAPIDEPCEGWLKDIIKLLESH